MEETNEFRHAVRVVLKRQMRNLLNQLEEVGEEVAVLTVNVEDQTCYHLASQAGEGFLTEQQHLTKHFLSYCEKYKSRPGTRSLLEPDEFSATQNDTRPVTRQAQSKAVGKSSPSKTAKRASTVTKGPGVKRPRQEPPSPALSTRSGRKISTRYLESLQLLARGNKKQIKPEPGCQEDIPDEAPEETITSGQCSENESEPPELDDDSNIDMPDKGSNSEETDPDFKPAVRVLSTAKPAPFKSIEEKIRKLKRKREKSLIEVTPLECEHCGVHIKGRTNLKSHIRRVHQQERNKKCQVCGVSFYSSTSLESHRLSVHTRQCEQCDQYVVEVEPWNEGINNRTRRRVVCTCGNDVVIFTAYGRSSTQLNDIEGDEQNNEKDMEDARYACGTCGKLFLKKYLCIQHSRRHSFDMPIVCDLCGRSFRYANSLKGHLEKEHGVMKLVCEICGKNYSNQSSLKAHMSKCHIKSAFQTEEKADAEDVSEAISTFNEVVQDVLGLSVEETKSENVQLLVTQQTV